MPRRRVVSRIALVCVAALAAAASGCSKLETSDGGWFSKPMDVFTKPDWARATGNTKTPDLGPTGPVKPEDLVGADGRCGAPSAEAAQASTPPAQPPAVRPVGSVAGDLAGAPMPASTSAAPDPGTPPVLGGIALGMTECQAVRRAGTPSNVSINGGDKGERNVELTYLSGTWPGIYRFSDGRLKIIDRAPAPPEQPKPAKKKIAKKKPAKP